MKDSFYSFSYFSLYIHQFIGGFFILMLLFTSPTVSNYIYFFLTEKKIGIIPKKCLKSAVTRMILLKMRGKMRLYSEIIKTTKVKINNVESN